MSSKSAFKFYRAVPAGSPGYYSYNLKSMRQIPILLGNANAGGGNQSIISAYVPASSWALNKNLLIRGFYLMTIPVGPLPPAYNVTEFINNGQSGPIALPTPGGFPPIAGQFTTWIQRNIVRIDPIQYGCDLGDVMKHNFANTNDTLAHVVTIAATIPPFDYSIPIQVDLQVNMPPTIPGATIVALWAEAFLEQATNLGKLP